MTSQLNVDTIVDKAGSGGSNIKMANTSTYVSDGGAVAQNTVQGIAKQWCQFEGDGTVAITDSFNVGSLTDTATGDYNLSYSNNMSNAGYSMTGGGIHDANSYIWHVTVDHDTTAFATASWQMNIMDHNNGQRDAELITYTIHGDLA